MNCQPRPKLAESSYGKHILWSTCRSAPAPADDESFLRSLFFRWSALPVWGGRTFLDRIRLIVRKAPPKAFVGVANVRRRRAGRWKIVVHVEDDIADAAATLLHEMAHVATWGEKAVHGPRWKRTFALAAGQAAGHPAWTEVEGMSQGRLDVAVRGILRRAMADGRLR